MEHMHLVVNLSNDSNSTQTRESSQIGSTGISLKLNKALLITKNKGILLSEEYYKYAIELKINGKYWVIFRRYSEVRDEHERMVKQVPSLKKLSFPPRSPFTKSDQFQMERQQKLEHYLRNFIELCLGDSIYDYSPTQRAVPANVAAGSRLSDSTMASATSHHSSSSPSSAAKLTKDAFCERFPFFRETTDDDFNVQKLNWKSTGDDLL